MLVKTAVEAAHQISQNGYIAELKQHGAKEVIKIGLAFAVSILRCIMKLKC